MLNSLGWHFIAVPAHERILATLDAERAARHAANDNVKRRRRKSAAYATDRFAAVSAETHHRASTYASPAAYSKGNPGHVYPEASPLSRGHDDHGAAGIGTAIFRGCEESRSRRIRQ